MERHIIPLFEQNYDRKIILQLQEFEVTVAQNHIGRDQYTRDFWYFYENEYDSDDRYKIEQQLEDILKYFKAKFPYISQDFEIIEHVGELSNAQLGDKGPIEEVPYHVTLRTDMDTAIILYYNHKIFKSHPPDVIEGIHDLIYWLYSALAKEDLFDNVPYSFKPENVLAETLVRSRYSELDITADLLHEELKKCSKRNDQWWNYESMIKTYIEHGFIGDQDITDLF